MCGSRMLDAGSESTHGDICVSSITHDDKRCVSQPACVWQRVRWWGMGVEDSTGEIWHLKSLVFIVLLYRFGVGFIKVMGVIDMSGVVFTRLANV